MKQKQKANKKNTTKQERKKNKTQNNTKQVHHPHRQE